MLLAVGGLWGLRLWSQRSSPPIDDLLPMLVVEPTSEPEAAPPAEVPPPVPATTSLPVAVLVHVSGAVARPGVVEVDAGGRVFEAIEAAGGSTGEADLDRLNLAAPLVDGERIHVPATGEAEPPQLLPPDRPAPGGVLQEEAAPEVDLNRATAAELQGLPGIGPALAAAVVDLRDARGPYAGVDELLLVDGIGPSKLEAIRPFVWVSAG